MTRRGVCPGSFDPVTYGHLDVITRATELFDEVVVAVMHNPGKSGFFDIETRLDLIHRSLPSSLLESERVRVHEFGDRLLVDVCREVRASAIVKGVRGSSDYGYEVPMARMNAHLSGVETVFLAADPSWASVSSSLVREVAAYGGDIGAFVPDVVQEALTVRGEHGRPAR